MNIFSIYEYFYGGTWSRGGDGGGGGGGGGPGGQIVTGVPGRELGGGQ